MKLTIIGTGYVGLVTGTCFAEVGHQVVCVDNNEEKVKLLQSGGIPIYEPGLEELVEKNVAEGRLSFTASTREGVEKSDIIFIAVPTPPQADGSVDLSFIEGVAREIAGAMTSYKIVVDKSTVPVNTGDKVAETIKRYCKAKVEFDVVSNPEFLREGFAVQDLMKPDRIVIGTRSQRPVAAMKEVYTPFNAPIIVTDINSAELIEARSELVSRAENLVYQPFPSSVRPRSECAGSGQRHGDGRGWTAVPRASSASAEAVFQRPERVHQNMEQRSILPSSRKSRISMRTR
jgi:UDPglucose 6-dehydrogenase